MPLTVSHAAAAACFPSFVRQDATRLAALVIGTMVPDFEYFRFMEPVAYWSHTLAGLVVFGLPVGLVTFLVWVVIVCDPVRDLLGLPPGERKPASIRELAVAALLIVMGAATHVLWDGVTHHGGWGLRAIPMLQETLLPLQGRPLTWAVALDYFSTMVGGAVVLTWFVRLLIRAGTLAAFRRSPWRWRVALAIALAATAIGLLNGSAVVGDGSYWTAEYRVARTAVGAMLGLGLGLVAFAVGHRALTRSHHVVR